MPFAKFKADQATKGGKQVQQGLGVFACVWGEVVWVRLGWGCREGGAA